jgi:hypothetical protein
MTNISERILIGSPPSTAVPGIERYLENKGNTLTLTLPLKALGLPTELELSRQVKVEFVPFRQNKLTPGRGNERVGLEWRPEGNGLYPTFKGQVIIRPMSGDTELELKGGYVPPLGGFGKMFDDVAGKRIAQATARELLELLRFDLEQEFAIFKSEVASLPAAQ